MADIVERMRAYIPGESAHEDATPEVLELAIAEIERLRARLKTVELERDRIGRNRDMWRAQSERQAEHLHSLSLTSTEGK